MKTLRVCLALLLLPVLGVVAQDAPEKDAPAVPPVELYKVKGRAWNYRVTSWERGNTPRVTNWTHKVTAVNEEAATVEWTSRATGSSGNGRGEHRFADEAEANKHWADPALPVATLDMGFAKFECNKHVAKEEGIETTTWVSREYHPLIVKQVKLGKDSCEVRRLTSFDSGEIDPFGLMKVVGRRVKLQMTVGDEVGFIEATVSSFDGSGCEWQTTHFDKDGNAKGEPSTERMEFSKRLQLMNPEGVEQVDVKGEAEIEVAAGEFACYVYEDERGKSKQFYSKQWPELPVKVESNKDGKAVTLELVEFDLGHDAMRFYRKAGNYYVLRSTTSFGGMDMESEMRMEVNSIKDGKAKYVIVSMDANGNEQMRNAQTLDVPAKEGAAMPYEDQVEETVTVAAGTFRCIKTEVEGSGMTMWMHHGVIVKSTMSADNVKMTQELTELKMD